MVAVRVVLVPGVVVAVRLCDIAAMVGVGGVATSACVALVDRRLMPLHAGSPELMWYWQ